MKGLPVNYGTLFDLVDEAVTIRSIEVLRTLLSAILDRDDIKHGESRISGKECIFEIMKLSFTRTVYSSSSSFFEKYKSSSDFIESFKFLADEVEKLTSKKEQPWSEAFDSLVTSGEYGILVELKPQVINFFFDEGYVDFKSLQTHNKEWYEHLGRYAIGDEYHIVLKERVHWTMKLKFFRLIVDEGWDFMQAASQWLTTINRLFWYNLDKDGSYDENEQHFVFTYLDYILKKWNPEIKHLSDIRSGTSKKEYHDRDSKEYKAIQYLDDLKSEQQRSFLLIDGIKAGMGLEEIKEILESYKGDDSVTKVKDRDQRNLVMISALKDRPDVIKILNRRYKIDISERDSGGRDALMLSKGAGSKSATKLLLKIKAMKIIPPFLCRYYKGRKQRKKFIEFRNEVRKACAKIQSAFRMYKVYSKFGRGVRRSLEQSKIYQEKWKHVIRIIDRALPPQQRIATIRKLKDNEIVSLRPSFSWIAEKLKRDIYADGDYHEADEIIKIAETSKQSRDDEAHDHSTEDELDDYDYDYDVPGQSKDASTNDIVVVNAIELTSQVYKWYERADGSYKGLLMKKLLRLCAGHTSYAMSKQLKGTKHIPVFESKLDKGQRILWSRILRDQQASILVWRISKHDDVSSHISCIDDSFKRSTSISMNPLENDYLVLNEVEILIDPFANRPLQIYSKPVNEIDTEPASSSTLKFPLRLTKKEKEINDTPGSVIIFGRSGTGKTLCLCDRLQQDVEKNSELHQLFVARSVSLCNLVKAYQHRTGTVSQGATFYTWKEFLEKMDQSITTTKGKSKYFNPERRVTFSKFRDEVWPQLKGKLSKRFVDSMTLSPSVVWTQILSFLKGSIEVVFDNEFGVLSEKQYLDKSIFSKDRCLSLIHISEPTRPY